MPKRKGGEVRSEKREKAEVTSSSFQKPSQLKRAKRVLAEAGRTGRESLDQIAEAVAKEIWEALGLVEVCEPHVLMEVAKEALSELVSSGREPSGEVVTKSLLKARDQIFKYVAVKLLERGVEKLNNKQIEFIIMNAPEIAGRLAPQLYREARERNLANVIEMLRDLWRVHGRPLPIKCPRCGFYAVAPDYQCVVCGETVSEEEVKRSLGFEELLIATAQKLPFKILEEIIFAGYVVYDGEVKPPSMKTLSGPIAYIIPLSKREKNALAEIALSKRLNEAVRKG